MLAAALRDGSANRPTTFEVFARRLPTGRRYGVVAGTGRLLEALPQFRFDADACELLAQFLDPATVRYLREFRFRGDIDGYAEGELYFPGSPVLSVRGSFAECVLLETLVLSIFNHDTAIASAAARMVSAAGGRPLIEMGSRRTHERAAVAAARAAYIAGFAASSNLAAQRRYGVPAHGTAAHAFTMLHAQHGGPTELAERAASAPRSKRWDPVPRCWWIPMTSRPVWPMPLPPPALSSARSASIPVSLGYWPAKRGSSSTG